MQYMQRSKNRARHANACIHAFCVACMHACCSNSDKREHMLAGIDVPTASIYLATHFVTAGAWLPVHQVGCYPGGGKIGRGK